MYIYICTPFIRNIHILFVVPIYYYSIILYVYRTQVVPGICGYRVVTCMNFDEMTGYNCIMCVCILLKTDLSNTHTHSLGHCVVAGINQG